MRKCLLLVLILGLLSCDSTVKVEVKTDGLKQKLDTGFEKIKDSAKAKGERTLDKLKEKVDKLGEKDTLTIKVN